MLTAKRLKKIQQVSRSRQAGIVVLEDVHDPHNAAAVLRSCDGFGFQKVIFIFEKEKYYNPKKIGKTTSASANKWLDIETYASTKKAIGALKRQGYNIIATTLNPKAQSIFKYKFKGQKNALCFGNEHGGLSQTAVNLADSQIYIPMRGFVQSLNISVTAAVCLYELSRQRQKKLPRFLVPKTQAIHLQSKWRKM